MSDFLLVIVYLATIYFFIANMTYILLNVTAFIAIRQKWFETEIADFDISFKSEFYKPLSIIIPAYNEEETIVSNLQSILALQYPEFEVVVVNDGSKDRTINKLKEEFDLVISDRDYQDKLDAKEIVEVYDSLDYPNLVVVDKKNGGKADALNAGINVAHYPLVCNIDADSLIDSKALLRLVEPFVKDWRVVAAGGTVRVANDSKIKRGEILDVKLAKNSLVRMQVVEYLRAFLFGRMGWSILKSLLIISGAFGIFRRKQLIDVGGYRTDTVGEDMELVLRLNRKLKKRDRDYRVVFLPDPVCWTQVPETIASLSSQRRRWQQGLGQSLLLNRKLLFNPSYGLLGMVAIPFFLFIEFLGPVIELIGYITIILTVILGIASLELVLGFFLASVLLGVLLSTLSLLFEELTFRKYSRFKEVLTLFVYGILENFGYRQLHAWWRLKGVFDFFRNREEWGEQERKSFEE